jgi:dihydroxy-acid dehydratase
MKRGITVVKGNICQDGAVIKVSAHSPFAQNTGTSGGFETIVIITTALTTPDLDIDENCVMVLKNVGPKKGYPVECPKWVIWRALKILDKVTGYGPHLDV